MKKNSSSLVKIVKILSDGMFHDGTMIGQSIGISRNSICKAIAKLKGYGIEIESVKAKGYRLHQPLLLLDETEIMKSTDSNALELDVVEKITSTNDYLRAFYGSSTTRFCIAEQQTKGRGRLNRGWSSPFGQNLCVSCLHNFRKDISELTGLSLVISLAVLRTVKAYIEVEPGIKWPNDILYDGAKLAGILVEVQAEANGSSSVIIGMGINVNMTEDSSHEILQPWTSLKKISGNYFDRNQIAVTLINHLMAYLTKFDRTGLAGFAREWNASDCLRNKDITVENGNKKITGCARGINSLGHLILEQPDQNIQTFSSGDTSICKE